MTVKGGGGQGVWGLGNPQFQVTLENFKWVGRGRGKIVMNANLKLLYKKKNARQQQRKVTWALAKLLNTLRTRWLVLTLCTSPYRSIGEQNQGSTAGSASGVVSAQIYHQMSRKMLLVDKEIQRAV